MAAIVLESLSGLCSVEQASERMGVALPRYYVLETRALQGLIGALEPRARGRQRSEASRRAELERERSRLERELHRYQALHRAASRALGVTPPVAKPTTNGRKKRAMRKRTRAERVVAVLREQAGPPQEPEGAEQGSSS